MQEDKSMNKVLRTNIEDLESNGKMLYMLTNQTSNTVALSKMTYEQLDQSWPVDAYLIYEDDKNTYISILSGHTVLSGQSKPFRESFEKIIDALKDEDFSIHVVSRVSSNQRKYVTCTLDLDLDLS